MKTFAEKMTSPQSAGPIPVLADGIKVGEVWFIAPAAPERLSFHMHAHINVGHCKIAVILGEISLEAATVCVERGRYLAEVVA